MKTWFEKLTQREQWALGIVALTLVALLVYLLFWQPVNAEQERLRTRLKEQTEVLVRMQQAVQEVLQLRGEQRTAVQERTDESLLALIDRTARATIVDGLNRLEPDGEHAVKLWLKGANFDRLVRWLQELQSGWGVKASVVSLQRAEQPGLVTGRLVMEEVAK